MMSIWVKGKVAPDFRPLVSFMHRPYLDWNEILNLFLTLLKFVEIFEKEHESAKTMLIQFQLKLSENVWLLLII